MTHGIISSISATEESEMELVEGRCTATAALVLLALFQERRPHRSQQISPLKLRIQHPWHHARTPRGLGLFLLKKEYTKAPPSGPAVTRRRVDKVRRLAWPSRIRWLLVGVSGTSLPADAGIMSSGGSKALCSVISAHAGSRCVAAGDPQHVLRPRFARRPNRR